MRGISELDHYTLLEIPRGATSAQVERAYRLAQETYGDGSLALYSVFENVDAAAIREHLDEAYRVLSDPETRSLYDATLEAESPAVASDGGATPERESRVAESQERSNSSHALADGIEADRLDSFEQAVDEYDALEDDQAGDFDGVRLRRARLFRGYEIDDISDVTKVSGSHLRNIEEENFHDLPADVYVRGFVTAYVQTIGLDPEIVVPSYMARVQESRSSEPRGRFLGRR